jgi:hypothetical protein
MKCNISKKEEQEYLQLLDPNGEGSVPYSEVLPLMAKRLETKETTDGLVSAFRVFDKQNRGAFSSSFSSSFSSPVYSFVIYTNDNMCTTKTYVATCKRWHKSITLCACVLWMQGQYLLKS